MTSTKSARLTSLWQKYRLLDEDGFRLQRGGKVIPIITRTGIDKIQAIENIKINYECVEYTPGTSAAIKATATLNDNNVQSYGEANEKNCKNPYPLAMAEKRAMSRVVLKLTGFYELGVYSEDEEESFKRESNTETKPWKNI
tara:strand:- start:9 stop:434 length:426 start_codon:yes stop_codon:yes gene_type:complete